VIATLGVRDLIVVDTPDAVLVCRRDRAQDIKKLTELLREKGHAAHV
jgi:mannose-1-phosphate guanylyltransferase